MVAHLQDKSVEGISHCLFFPTVGENVESELQSTLSNTLWQNLGVHILEQVFFFFFSWLDSVFCLIAFWVHVISYDQLNLPSKEQHGNSWPE